MVVGELLIENPSEVPNFFPVKEIFTTAEKFISEQVLSNTFDFHWSSGEMASTRVFGNQKSEYLHDREQLNNQTPF